ncbi:MAG TPA: XrtA system polysaccharide chain length determinant [Candidatus Acidoferrales bacterium]|nr:XrtA system polysaccharide chain length determinant [Candidatus Acidoferrales bacterium]
MTQRELTPADYLTMLRRHWVMIVILTIIGPPLGYGISKFLPNRYQSMTLVLVEEPSVPTDFVKPVDTTNINERLASMQQQILSRTRLEPIIHQYGLYASDINKVSMDDLVARLQKAIEVTPVEPMAETRANNLPGFFVNVTMDSARTAQEVCSSITSMFIEENLRLRQERSEDTTQFLSQQLADSKAKLDEQDAKLAAFKSHYMGSLPDEEQTNLNILTGLTSQLDAATQALSRAQQDKSFAESMLAQQLAGWQASENGQSPDTMEKQLAALQTQLAGLEVRYTNDYPDVIKTKSDIAALQKKIADENSQRSVTSSNKVQKTTVEPVQITQLRAQIHSYDQAISGRTKEQEQIQQQIKLYQGRVQSSPAVEQQYKELTRGYQTALDAYNDLQKKVGESAMATDLERKQEGEQFRVLDPANLPDRPSFPNRPLFAAGGLGGGLVLGVGLALLMEMQNSSMRTERDVEFALRLPVLAIVPAIQPNSSRKTKRPEGSLPSLGQGARV